MSKTVNLQPWLDYFEMLHTYEQKGFLQSDCEKHEAYVTRSSLHTLSGEEDTLPATTSGGIRRMRAYVATVRRLRAYAAWQSREGRDYLERPFAVHVVKEEPPHDLLCTILLDRRRRWQSLWFKADSFDVITYDGHGRL